MEMSVKTIRDNLADAINRVAYAGERVVLTRKRKGVAALVSMEDLAALQKLTGARVYVMRGDDQVIASGGKGQYLYPADRWDPCKVDRVLKDRDEVKLGGVTLVAHLTPDHAPRFRAAFEGEPISVRCQCMGLRRLRPGESVPISRCSPLSRPKRRFMSWRICRSRPSKPDVPHHIRFQSVEDLWLRFQGA